MSAAPILLDTCAALWLGQPGGLRETGEAALQQAVLDGNAVFVSPITAWEVGLLVSRRRFSMSTDPLRWFETLTARVRLAELSAKILVASSFLPQGELRDPADRIIAATAREFGYRLMTRDRPLLAYAEAGHLQAIAC